MTVRVLVVIPTLAVGGAEMDLLRVLPRIDRTRFAVDVWTYQDRGELASQMEAAGIAVIGPAAQPVVETPKRRGLLERIGAVARLLATIAAGARLLRRGKYDVVHAILPGSYLVAVLATALARRGQVAMSRLSQNWYQADHRLFGRIERQVLHRAVTAAIGNAVLILDELRAEGVAERKLSLIRNGIDIAAHDASRMPRLAAREQLGLPAEALVLTAVANLHRYKGYDDLIEALALAAPRLPPDWVLLVAGSDREGNHERLETFARSKGLERQVRFLGPRLDVPVLLGAADIHITASHAEGLPNNVIEAMVAGLPVIGTAIGGIPELVTDGRTGRLVPARDAKTLALAIAELGNNPELRQTMGRAGRRAAEASFTLERTVSELSAMYEDVAASEREGRQYYARPVPRASN